MAVVILIIASLGVVGFIMLSDTRRNNNFKKLEQRSDDRIAVDDSSDAREARDGGEVGSSGAD